MKVKKTQPNVYRVPVAVPLEWKVKAVAEFKKRKYTQELLKKNNSFSVLPTPPTKDTQLDNPLLSPTLNENTPVYEAGQAKLEQLYQKGHEVRSELRSLNNVRCSLLWLLKKANKLEVQRNHTNPQRP